VALTATCAEQGLDVLGERELPAVDVDRLVRGGRARGETSHERCAFGHPGIRTFGPERVSYGMTA
jgi:hypothetical protein